MSRYHLVLITSQANQPKFETWTVINSQLLEHIRKLETHGVREIGILFPMFWKEYVTKFLLSFIIYTLVFIFSYVYLS